jgi:predicted RNase H-like HicB family nuclease
MRKLARQIYVAGKRGELPPMFKSNHVAEACPGWAESTYGTFLSKHRTGNLGGNTELFERVGPGWYRLLTDKVDVYLFKAEVQQEEDGRWSSWICELPGCAAWGASQDQALSALEDAAKAYIEDVIDAGETPPREDVETGEHPVVAIAI